MKTQCSIIASALGSLTESPLHVLQGNQVPDPQFWAIFFSASSIWPPFHQLESNGYTFSDDPAANALAENSYCLTHTWGFKNGDDSEYTQKDSADAASFVVTSEVVVNTAAVAPAPLDWANPIILRWPNLEDGSSFASGGSNYDPSDDRSALLTAVMSVDFSKFWSGEQIPVPGTPINPGGGDFLVGYIFDRSFNSPNAFGNAPDGTLKSQAGAGRGATKQPILTGGPVVQSGINVTGGFISNLSFTRAQYQARNLGGRTYVMNFVELYSGSRFIADGNLKTQLFYRDGGSVTFHTDNQVEEVPLPSIQDFPTSATGSDGLEYILTFGQTLPLIGQTVAEYVATQGGLPVA